MWVDCGTGRHAELTQPSILILIMKLLGVERRLRGQAVAVPTFALQRVSVIYSQQKRLVHIYAAISTAE